MEAEERQSSISAEAEASPSRERMETLATQTMKEKLLGKFSSLFFVFRLFLCSKAKGLRTGDGEWEEVAEGNDDSRAEEEGN